MFDVRYNPSEAEDRIYRMWDEGKAFRADPSSKKQPYVIVIPPPNVTGSLHMGHALNNTLQDMLIRWKRMSGMEALYLPGTDHAGIATQNVVEKELKKEKKSRFDMGREKFVEKVWEWKEKYGNTILYQLRRLGCSCDWSRTRFTMDEGYSKAVKTVFVALHRKGLIYRGHYTINWCPRCLTALSDIEVTRSEEKGKLWHMKYPIKGGGEIVVATTRPETMLGDTAVAVNPKDPRYKGALGKSVILPFVGREIPVIADDFVDPEFGTGAVKITPAHDVNDFEASRRHNLPAVTVMDEKGKMNGNAAQFKGLDRFEARKRVVEELTSQGLLEKIEDYTVPLGKCHRCETIIEPYLSEQWFVKMAPLAKPAGEAVEQGKIRFTPERWKNIYMDWITNAKDWCISRQIWWGHRIPIWYCRNKHATASVDEPKVCGTCGDGALTQESDVLDTWFSSALWPFATMGWPDETESLKRFYPTQTLVTARDIIYLWVARMIMTGLEFRGDIPFADVFINPTIQNAEGKRMSKSLGTGVDPLELIDQYGADAVRFGLAVQVSQSQDLRYSPAKIEQARNFATKFWNACRFVHQKIGATAAKRPEGKNLRFEDRWILCRLETTIRDYTVALEEYQFGPALQMIYKFVWNEFCDWYIELAKRREEDSVKEVLCYCVDRMLRILHPIMPFVTEEIWQKMAKKEGDSSFLMSQEWPSPDVSLIDREVEEESSMIFDIVRGVRDIRQSMDISRSVKLSALIDCRDEKTAAMIGKGKEILLYLGGLDQLTIGRGLKAQGFAASVVGETHTLLVPLEGKIDREAEIKKQNQKKDKIVAQLERTRKKLDDQAFVRGAPEEIVEGERERLSDLESQLRAVDAVLASFGGR